MAAAGLWVTSAIGMTAGAGMYALSAVATALVLICLEGSDFIHHKIFHEKADTDDSEKEEGGEER